MAEIFNDPTPSLLSPEAGVAEFWNQYRQVGRIATDLMAQASEQGYPDGMPRVQHVVDIDFPQVVGKLEGDEEQVFDTLKNYGEYDVLFGALPRLQEIIDDDLKVLGLDQVLTTESERYADVLLHNKPQSYTGSSPLSPDDSGWHTDSSLNISYDEETGVYAHEPRLYYLISNPHPTDYYKGPIRLWSAYWGSYKGEHNMVVASDRKIAPSADTEVRQSRPYEVVRLGPLAMHSPPRIPESVRRTLVRVTLDPPSNKGNSPSINLSVLMAA